MTYFATAGGGLTSSDAVVTFEVTRSIVDQGTVAVPESALGWDAHRGRDGRFYAPFGVGQSLVHVPVYLVAKAVVAATGASIGKPDTLPKAAIAMSQTIVVATLVWLTFHAGIAATGSVRASALGAVTLAFASAFWPYSGFGFNQPLAAVVVLAAAHEAAIGVRDPRRLWWAGIWIGAAMHVRHELVLVAIPIGVWLLAQRTTWVQRGALVWRIVPGAAIGVAAWLAFNAWRYGNPFDPGYLEDETVKFFSSIGEGLAGLLVSPGASLFLYSPVALAGLVGLVAWARTDRQSMGTLALGISLTFLLFYASIGSWSAGRSYGARYLLVILPLLALGWTWWLARVSRQASRRAFGAVMAIGLLVQAPGVLVDYSKVSQDARRVTGHEREWRVGASPWVLNARAVADVLPRNLAYLSGAAPRPAVAGPAGIDDRGFSQQFRFSLDLWWCHLFYLGVFSVGGVWAIALALAAAWIAAARFALACYGAALPCEERRPVPS